MTQFATPPRFGTQPIEDADDLFASPPPRRAAPLTARVTCQACPTPRLVEIPILRPARLCDECYRDLDATARHIAETERLAQARRDDTWDRFAAAWAQADDATTDQFDRILAQKDSADFPARLARAHQLPDWAGALALWRLRVDFDQASHDCDRVEQWAARAREELHHATL